MMKIKNVGFHRKRARSQIDPNINFDPFHKSAFYFEYSSTNISSLLLFEFRTVIPKISCFWVRTVNWGAYVLPETGAISRKSLELLLFSSGESKHSKLLSTTRFSRKSWGQKFYQSNFWSRWVFRWAVYKNHHYQNI